MPFNKGGIDIKIRKVVKAFVSVAGVSSLISAIFAVGCEETIAPFEPPGDGRTILIYTDRFDPRNPLWSPACDRVAFERYELPFNGYPYLSYLCIYDIGGGTFTDVTTAGQNPRIYDWSPDGKWIAYDRHDDPGLYIIRPDGSENIQVSQPSMGSTGGSFSPDGQKITFFSYAGLMVADISDVYDVKYTILPGNMPFDGGYWYGPPLWCPDGRIACTRVYEDEYDWTIETRVYLIDPEEGDAGEWVLLLAETADEWYGIFPLRWSHDGRYLLFLGSRTTDYTYEELWAYELETGEYHQITKSDNISDPEYGDWGTNGKIVFEDSDTRMRDGNPYGPWHVIYTIDAPP